jgi:sugar O-acyltransferase (sialic acid O-acetyltransferase NeuD family)
MSGHNVSGVRHPLQLTSHGERVVIVGTGETAAIAWDYLTCDSPHEVVAFSTEASYLTNDRFYDRPVVALDELPRRYPPASHRVLVAVSSTELNRLRRRLYDIVKKAGFDCISYVSSAAFVWPTVPIGENTFIFENNVVQRSAQIGRDVIMWSGNHVGHQTVIEDDCFIASHVVISSACTIGRGSYLGVNSCLRDGLSLGEECVIGAGAVVVKDTKPHEVYVGNPARPTGRDSLTTMGVRA